MDKEEKKKAFDAMMQKYRQNNSGGHTGSMEAELPLPDGVYRCLTRGRHVEPAQGKPYLGLTHNIIEGEFSDRNIYQNIYSTLESLKYSYEHFCAFNLFSHDLVEKAVLSDWICDVTLKKETDRNGRERQVVTELVVVEKGKNNGVQEQ